MQKIQHVAECILNEDNVIKHDCGYIPKRYFIEWDERWRLEVDRGINYRREINIDYCPYCGEELEMPKCTCPK